MRRPHLQRLILAIAFFALIGGNRGAIQCVAWGKMLWERSAENSFSEAVASTFSGEEPCEICEALRECERGEEDRPALLPTVKIELGLVSESPFIPVRRPLLATYPEWDAPGFAAGLAPPTPPPPQVG